MTMAAKSVILVLALLILAGTPVSAYSAEAVSRYASGTSFLESGNDAGAIAAFVQAVALEPSYYEAWNGLADARNRVGAFGEALEASNRSLEINPAFVTGWINRGQILYNIGYYYEDVVKDQQKADIFYAEQLAAFGKAISLDPQNAEAWFNKGYALGGLKRYDEAIAAFDTVYALDPSYPNLQKNREIAVQLRDLATKETAVTPVVQASAVTEGSQAPAVTPVATRQSAIPLLLVITGIAAAVLIRCRQK